MGFKRTKAHLYFRSLKADKKKRMGDSQVDTDRIFIDDLAIFSGLSRDAIKSGLLT